MFRVSILVYSFAALLLIRAKLDENSEYEFKLGRTDNDAKWRGRLEIKKDGGEWGSVCYDRGTVSVYY
jgi:hypothetical protein